MGKFKLPSLKAAHNGMLTMPLDAPAGKEGGQNLLAAMMRLDSMPWVLVVVDDVGETCNPCASFRC